MERALSCLHCTRPFLLSQWLFVGGKGSFNQWGNISPLPHFERCCQGLANCVTGFMWHQPVLCGIRLGDNQLVLYPILPSSLGERDNGVCSWGIQAWNLPPFSCLINHSPTWPGGGLAVAKCRTFLPLCSHTAAPQPPPTVPPPR